MGLAHLRGYVFVVRTANWYADNPTPVLPHRGRVSSFRQVEQQLDQFGRAGGVQQFLRGEVFQRLGVVPGFLQFGLGGDVQQALFGVLRRVQVKGGDVLCGEFAVAAEVMDSETELWPSSGSASSQRARRTR